MDISKRKTKYKIPGEDSQMQEYFLNFQNFDCDKNLKFLKTRKILHPIQGIMNKIYLLIL